MAGAFNLVIVRAAFSAGRLPGRDLVFLATLGGLTINTRPSVGVALCLGTILLVAWTMWCRLYVPHRRARVFSSKEARLITTVLPPIAVLGLTAVAVGVINFERWGNPLTFADFRLYDWLYRHAGFADALRNYGEFDVGRMWIGVLYYATGIPFMLKAAPPFAEFLRARYQGIEAPPVIPLLTNPISVLLAGVGRYCLWWRPELPARSLAMLRFALVGHASTVLLILSAMYLALRYRFDFAPFVTLAASIGYRSISITAAGAQRLGESSCVSPLSACASLAFSPATCGASQCRWRSASLCFLSHRSPTPRSSRDW